MKKILLKSLVVAVAGSALWILVSCTGGDATAEPRFIFKDAPKPGVAAKIGDIEITKDELIGDARMEIMRLEKQIHEIKIARLKKLIEEKMIGKKAEEKKMSLDEYVDKVLMRGKGKVSKSEYKKFIKERQIPTANINDDLKNKIYDYLKKMKRAKVVEAAVAKITKKTAVEVYFKEPDHRINVEVGDAPVKGNKNAKVTIVEFSEFQCPFCKKGAGTVDKVVKKYGSKVKLVFKHFPLAFHTEAKNAGVAAECAGEQNKFWKMYDKLFGNQDEITKDDGIKNIAKKAGLDMKKFEECIKADRGAKKIENDMELAGKLGINSVPTFFINGVVLQGAQPIEEFSKVIDKELQKK